MLILLAITVVSGQESDPEAEDLRARVTDISWDIDSINPTDLMVEFTISLEVWNPYDGELTTYGSSSCRWYTAINLHLNPSVEYEDYTACTDDYSPRAYLSGKSDETSTKSLVFMNQSFSNLPDGQYLISAGHNSYRNNSDLFFGLNMTLINGVAEYEYEAYPLNWGSILYSLGPDLRLNSAFLPAFIAVATVAILGRYVSRNG